jgi:hypothetical protein
VSLQDPASREAMRRFGAHWQSDARLAGVKDQSIVDRIAAPKILTSIIGSARPADLHRYVNYLICPRLAFVV